MIQAKTPIMMKPTKDGLVRRTAVMDHGLLMNTLIQIMKTTLVKKYLGEPPDYSHDDTSHQREYEGETESNISFKEGDECHGEETERDNPEADQEDSWQEEPYNTSFSFLMCLISSQI
ncbi:hypothetical protein F2Q70_00044405 [Brassica cretica]|uniref:Uncharacterized protein n=2 Tax=Brassica cretica TaxID=69181 RepID=A0A8S9LRT1_BRACR|nr:hypothetical protein F2Q70_00044405 [Brassica cretica]KAF2608549.1 hypothetical protein F2Q68_00045359 [Brassica cretica]KAF3517466.1 hypothetical protein DY000_02062176 [Brassica cretica]KAF3517472.1 hypothetical protein DY000_02062178 [Brassica cretica]